MQRGGSGGAVMALPHETSRLGALVRLMEQGQSLVECFAPGGGKYTIIGCGRPKARLRSAEAAFLTA